MLTEEQLKAIEDCGSAEMPLDETAIIAECEEADIISDPAARARYNKGQLQSKLKIRQAVVRMAREGVPQMVKIYQEFSKTALPEIPIAPEDEFNDSLPELPNCGDDDE